MAPPPTANADTAGVCGPALGMPAASARGLVRGLRWRLLAGLLIGAAILCSWSLWRAPLFADPKVVLALWGGLVAAGATALGTLPVLLSQRSSERTRDAMLGFGA